MTNLQKNHKGNTKTFFYFVKNWREDCKADVPSPPKTLIYIYLFFFSMDKEGSLHNYNAIFNKWENNIAGLFGLRGGKQNKIQLSRFDRI